MPISSEQVAAQIAQVHQEHSSMVANARRMSTMGLGGEVTPDYARQQSAMEQGIPAAAGMTASAIGSMPGTAMAITGMAASFGYAPRVMDPFSMSMHAGGVARAAGMGWGGAIGAGAATFAGYAALGSAVNYLAVDPFRTGAQSMGQAQSAAGQMFPQHSMESLTPLAQQMRGMQSAGMASMPDIQASMGMGIQSGMINPRSSVEQIQMQFGRMMTQGQQASIALNTSMPDAITALHTMQQLGVQRDRQVGMLTNIRGLGFAGGFSPQQALDIAASGSQAAGMAGIDREVGMRGALTNAAVFGMVGRDKLIQGVGAEDTDTYTNAAYKFMGSGKGQMMLASIMGDNGEIDPVQAQRMATGGISRQSMERRYRSIIGNNEKRDLFSSNSGSLAATYMAEYGPAAVMPALDTLTGNMRMRGSARQQLTGLNNEQLENFSRMGGMNSQLKSALTEAMEGGFRSGTEKMGIGEQISASMDQLTKPLRDRFDDFGAQMTRIVQGKINDLVSGFVRNPPRGADPTLVREMFSQQIMGNTGAAKNIQSFISGGGDPYSGANVSWEGPSKTGLGNLLPRALGAVREGVSPLEMPYFGLMPASQEGGLGAGGLVKSLYTTGAGAVAADIFGSGVGRGLGNLAGKIAGNSAISFSGAGLKTAARKAGSLIPRVLGFGASALGRLAAPVGVAMMAKDVMDEAVKYNVDNNLSMGNPFGEGNLIDFKPADLAGEGMQEFAMAAQRSGAWDPSASQINASGSHRVTYDKVRRSHNLDVTGSFSSALDLLGMTPIGNKTGDTYYGMQQRSLSENTMVGAKIALAGNRFANFDKDAMGRQMKKEQEQWTAGKIKMSTMSANERSEVDKQIADAHDSTSSAETRAAARAKLEKAGLLAVAGIGTASAAGLSLSPDQAYAERKALIGGMFGGDSAGIEANMDAALMATVSQGVAYAGSPSVFKGALAGNLAKAMGNTVSARVLEQKLQGQDLSAFVRPLQVSSTIAQENDRAALTRSMHDTRASGGLTVSNTATYSGINLDNVKASLESVTAMGADHGAMIKASSRLAKEIGMGDNMDPERLSEVAASFGGSSNAMLQMLGGQLEGFTNYQDIKKRVGKTGKRERILEEMLGKSFAGRTGVSKFMSGKDEYVSDDLRTSVESGVTKQLRAQGHTQEDVDKMLQSGAVARMSDALMYGTRKGAGAEKYKDSLADTIVQLSTRVPGVSGAGPGTNMPSKDGDITRKAQEFVTALENATKYLNKMAPGGTGGTGGAATGGTSIASAVMSLF